MRDETETFMAMKGAGYYSRATTGARDVINGALPLIEDLLSAEGNDGPPLTFSDMGAADGGTSLPMWSALMAGLRKRLPDRAMQLIYTDLPKNDFSQLFQIVHGQTDIESGLADLPGLSIMASATSFHRPILPPGQLRLGFSATASHYIVETPCDIPDHVHMVGALGDVRAAYQRQGAQDWEKFLLARTAELQPGGHLVLYNFGIDQEGRYLGHTGGVSMFDTFSELWHALADDGVITQKEYRTTNFPQVYRSVEEFVAPLESSASPVHAAGLRLASVKTQLTPCPYATAFAKGGQSAADFAKAYIPTLRSWSEPTFVNGLSANRPAAEKREIVDQFYAAYEARVAADPAGHGMDYIHAVLVCEKS
ncbi:hypothetical protein [Primorskyibacter sp. S187A]|uniref:hypothetical protein n=1 Tax=Primorskyibacter sp. S187A TaxID=3415130 RepID=UPI003C7B96D0